jgi:uncharacterized membrane protein YccC
VGVWLGHPTGSAIAIMGAWFVGLVNVEGVYRQKAMVKIIATISFTAMLFLANLVHPFPWLSVLTTFVVIFITGFVGLFGQAASSVGLMTSIMFIVALARFATFPNWATVLEQCALCVAGGLWSIALSVGIWQFRPYKPVIQAVANCYDALSQLMEAVKAQVGPVSDRQTQLNSFLQAQDTFTQALTAARDRWSAAWTAQRAGNVAGNQLLVLMENTPLIANCIVTLVEQILIASEHPLFRQLQSDVQQAMEQVTFALQKLSQAIATGKSSIHLEDLDRAIEALAFQQQRYTQSQERTVIVHPDEYIVFTSLDKIVALFTQLTNQIHADGELITSLRWKRPSYNARAPKKVFPKLPDLSSILGLLQDNLSVHSVLFRHALRLAIVATIAELLASWLQIPRGYWITLTAVVALKPNYGGTYQTTLQRVMGTVLGGVLGVAIVALIHNPWLIGGCLLLLIMSAVAVRPLSFSLFITLLTPAIILLLNVTSQGGWQIGATRVADSLAGGVLAILGSYLLFPNWERQQLPGQLVMTIQANLAYFQQVIAAYLHPDAISAEAIAPLRRQAALENTNMTAAAQRLFSEPRHIRGDIEPITMTIFYIRRFFNSVIALAEHKHVLHQDYQCSDFKQFTDAVIQVLENLVIALQQQQSPLPLPDFDRYLDAIHHHIQQLHSDRIASITDAHANVSVYPSTAIREHAPISASLDQIAGEIQNIHSAIVHFHQCNIAK